MEKKLFDKSLIEEDYEILNYCIWELPYEVDFAISMMHELEYDICGNRINDLESIEPLKKIYLNIFPAAEKSFCIWSWLKIYDDCYVPFAGQFIELNDKDRKNYLNNNMPRWSDSIIISPRLWEKWGSQIQQALIIHANSEMLYRQMEDETNTHSYKYMDTPWDFFSNENH